MSILLLNKSNTLINKKAVQRFYKSERYAARFIGHDHCFVYIDKQQTILAAVIISTVMGDNFLHALVTRSECQRAGIGRELIEHCKNHFTSLICFADIKLTPLYDKSGFIKNDEKKLNSELYQRWQSYQKKNPQLTMFKFVQNDESLD